MSAPSQQAQEEAPSVPTHRFARFNPFREDEDEGGDELGEEVNETSIAGGGHAIGGKADGDARDKLRVSHALRSFLAQVGEIPEGEVGGDDSDTVSTPAVQSILARPQIVHPSYVNEKNHPLSEYLVSSSHNTYLVGKQLYGSADSMSYKHHLAAGARCVEIDAWNDEKNAEEPKVTHGYTLTDHVPFRKVCEAINSAMDDEITASKEGLKPAPIFISLENHCTPPVQLRLAAIMREVFGEKLVSEQVHKDGCDVMLDEMGGRILVMVEYYGLDEKDVPEDAHNSSDDEDSKAHREKKTANKPTKIVPELAELGVYAQSMKPANDDWLNGELKEPVHHLVNVEERAVKGLIETGQGDKVAIHNASHFMRIFPKGTRIGSQNLNPVPFWGVGAQVCALNWQTFDASMQLNEALFASTDGWVLKPPCLRKEKGAKPKGKVELKLEVAGATDLAIPEGRTKDLKPYVTCTLYHPDQKGKPEKSKTDHYRVHAHKKLFGKEQPPATSPVWDPPEELKWTYNENDFAFLRILIKSDDAFAKNPAFLTSAVRLTSIPEGWHFMRMLNLRGAETKSTLLVRFTKKVT
ncbi:hypothetical protein CBS101457_002443 [Exobasidium rhododendri]|nr:hypothetical protein CBS101457_002443 [Exobasidium rhododendri]